MSKVDFRTYLGGKTSPSPAELSLFARTQKYVPWISWIPGIRMIAICNSLSMYAADDESDIDLFIVTDPDRIWLVRGLITAIFQLLGVRRHGTLTTGRFCLSFFATTRGMELSKFAIEGDIYLQTWGKYLKPIYSQGGAYEEFLAVNKEFLEDISEGEMIENMRYIVGDNTSVTPIKLGILYSLLNRLARATISPITLREYHRLEKPWGVIISDDLLKFHPHDRRVKLREEWGVKVSRPSP